MGWASQAPTSHRKAMRLEGLFFLLLPCCKAYRILVSPPGIEPGTWQWELRVLISRLPGNSRWVSLWTQIMFTERFRLLWRTCGCSPPSLPTLMAHTEAVCMCVCVLVTQSYPTLCDPMDCSLPGSSVHGILQARILEWVAIPFSIGSSRSGHWIRVSHIAGRFFTIWASGEAPSNK